MFVYLFKAKVSPKCKEEVFVVLYIRSLFQDYKFDVILEGDEKADWNSFKLVYTYSIVNERAENYTYISTNLPASYSNLGCNVLVNQV